MFSAMLLLRVPDKGEQSLFTGCVVWFMLVLDGPDVGG